MANKSTYEELLMVTLERYVVDLGGEQMKTRCIHLTIDSLEIEESLFVAVIERSFPQNKVRRLRVGKASLDLYAPIGVDDQILVERLAERIGQVAELVLVR